MLLNWEKIQANVRAASTEDLLDRATVYREGTEAEALDLIEGELRERGISRDTLAAHEAKRRAEVLFDSSGIARTCSRCNRPAVKAGQEWHRLWGLLPLFRRRAVWCERHAPDSVEPRT